MSPKEKTFDPVITVNKKAGFDYFIEERYEAGLVLEGWEVKSLRQSRVQLVDSYIFIKRGEAFLLGTLITPLLTVSTHFTPDQKRTRKLLLNRKELNKLIGATEREGYTVIPTKMYWKHNRVKLEIGLAKGKKQHDKRATVKDRDWERTKAKLLRHK
jgi:SsrA-binding protein